MILTPNDPELGDYYRSFGRCFRCAHPFDGVETKITWSGYIDVDEGSSIDIAFHRKCAEEQALHLASDALRASYTEDPWFRCRHQ